MSTGTQPTEMGWVLNGSQGILAGTPGGVVKTYLAGVALNVGDAVFISAAATVSKAAASAAQQSARIGIVVGGELTGYECADDPAVVGRAAAGIGGRVLVCVLGSAYTVAEAAIAAGVRVRISATTAGRVQAATDPVVAAGAVAVTSSAANGAIVSGDGFNRILGLAETAAAGAASVFLVTILQS